MLKVYPPPTKRTVHWSSINRARAAEEDAVEVPVKRLATIAGELGHDRIDVLKLDIDRFGDTLEVIESMRAHGFGIFDISRRALEFSFLKQP